MEIFLFFFTSFNVFTMNLCELIDEVDFRMIGGHNALAGEAPYQLAFIGKNEDMYHLCGAAILDEHHFLTSAHCSDLETDNFTVVAGSIILGKLSEPKGIVFPVDKMFTKGYVFETAENDIAIGRIEGRFVWSPDVKPIELSTERATDAKDCVISGWGRYYDAKKNIIPEILQVASLPPQDMDVCKEAFPKDVITKDKLCAGEIKVRPCHGDSGGPYVCDGSLTAVLSQIPDCAQENLPVVLTDIKYHKKWITKTLKKSHADIIELP